MKSVGEVMAIGRNLKESLQKALRGLETGLDGFNRVDELEGASRDEINAALSRATPDRLLVVGQAFREGFTVEDVHAVTKYEPWFLRHIAEIIAEEENIIANGLPAMPQGMRRLKAMGFGQAPGQAGGAFGTSGGQRQHARAGSFTMW
jgi:carbamoyl-phosphate synthase large subunit